MSEPPRHARWAIGGDGPRLLMPGDPAYAEIGLVDPNGSGTAFCEIVPGQVTTLSGRVRRLTAPNAGMMTGPGTNTYLLGTGREMAVIDPGPADAAHLQALLAVGDSIRWIFATHTHPDHSPGAAELARATGAAVLGMPAPAGGNQDVSFAPDRILAHGDRVAVAGCMVQVVHTPGHASNHLCYLLEEERLLFTGDHVMQGSTVVINPPDGDMAAYIASLRMLRGLNIAWFAPGHGFLIGDPDDMIERLIRHRAFRENKVLRRLREGGAGALEAILPVVYDDVPPRKHPWAARSLLAHLLKLQGEGTVDETDGLWSARC